MYKGKHNLKTQQAPDSIISCQVFFLSVERSWFSVVGCGWKRSWAGYHNAGRVLFLDPGTSDTDVFNL